MGREGITYLRTIKSPSFPNAETAAMLKKANDIPPEILHSVRVIPAGEGRSVLVVKHVAEYPGGY